MSRAVVDVGLWQCTVSHRVGGVMFTVKNRRQVLYGACEFVRGDIWNAISRSQREGLVMGFFDRERKREEGASAGGQVVDEAFAKKHSTVLEVLTARGVVEGQETNRMSLSLFTQDGQWKAILKDKIDGLCLWVTAQTIAGLWTSLEACLIDPDTVWRKDRYAGSRSASRTKRK